MKTICRALAAAVGAFLLAVTGSAVYLSEALPDSFYVAQGETFSMNWVAGIGTRGLSQSVPASLVSRAGNAYRTELTLGKSIPIKAVSVQVVEPDMVIPGGTPFGIKMFTSGVVIVGMSDIDIAGKAINPAKECGLRAGDVILTIGGETATGNEQVGELISQSGGAPVEIVYSREGETKSTMLTPVESAADGGYRAGMWVRDSTAGIGTLTCYDPATHSFIGLGHAVCDADTNTKMPLGTGEAVHITITGVTKGVAGIPGELHGMFTGQAAFGSLVENAETGIYGKSQTSPIAADPIPIASAGEVEPGKAVIRTTIDGKVAKEYDIVIEKIHLDTASTTKNMVIRVVDDELLSKTGGIVQGMSGSPIIQNGKLIGAVTHVLVNDPTRGYGIFIENMLDKAA